jgi:hypothetical protein
MQIPTNYVSCSLTCCENVAVNKYINKILKKPIQKYTMLGCYLDAEVIPIKCEPEFGIGLLQTSFEFEKITFYAKFERNETPVYNDANGCIQQLHELLLYGPSIELISNFIRTAMLDSEEEERNHISIWSVFSYEAGCYRKKIGSRLKRPIETVFLNKELKQTLLDDIDTFLNSSDKYDQHGIPYKRNYLLEGHPGTGKSSLVGAIASMLNYDVAIIKLDSPDIKLEHVLHEIPDKCILLIEDIQHCFPSYNGFNGGVSVDAILNILDGIYHKRGLLTFMTLNPDLGIEFPENLLRAGRVDMRFVIEPPNEELIKEIYKSFYPKGNVNKFLKMLDSVSGTITPAVLQNFLFNNPHPDNLDLLQYIVTNNNKSEVKQKHKKRKVVHA